MFGVVLFQQNKLGGNFALLWLCYYMMDTRLPVFVNIKDNMNLDQSYKSIFRNSADWQVTSMVTSTNTVYLSLRDVADGV